MMLQDDVNRIIMVFGFQAFLIVFFFFIVFKILKRGRTYQTFLVSLTYLFVAFTFIFNLIYYFIYIETIVLILYLFAYYFMIIAQVLFLISNIYMYYHPRKFKNKSQISVFIIEILVFTIPLFFPSSITINEATEWKPVFSEILFLSLVLCYTFIITVPNVYFSIKTHKALKIPYLKKRHSYYLIGVFIFHSIFYWVIIYNTFDNEFLRVSQSLYHILVTIPGSLLLYYGMGKDLNLNNITNKNLL